MKTNNENTTNKESSESPANVVNTQAVKRAAGAPDAAARTTLEASAGNGAALSAHPEHPRFDASEVACRDAMAAASSRLHGAAEALSWRAASEGDDMLALIAEVVDTEADALRAHATNGGDKRARAW